VEVVAPSFSPVVETWILFLMKALPIPRFWVGGDCGGDFVVYRMDGDIEAIEIVIKALGKKAVVTYL